MLAVVAVAPYSDKRFWKELTNGLAPFFSVLHTHHSRLAVPRGKAELLVADSCTFESIESDLALLIFKDTEQFSLETVKAKQIVAVVDSRNAQLVSFVSSTKLPAITCGLSPRDTITLSSIAVDSAVINLQRTVTCFDGSVVEPQEIPLKIGSEIDNYTLMALASVFIMSGNIQKLLNIQFLKI